MPRHIGVGADPHAGRTIAPKHAILLKHGHSRMLAFSPARRAPPHVKGARRVQRGGRFLMCSACAMPKKEKAASPRTCHAWGSFIRPMRAAANTSRLMYPKTDSGRSNAPVAAATFPQVYPVTQPALPKSYPVTPCHSRRGRHCRTGHFPLHAKNRSSEFSDDLFSLVSAPTYFPGPLPAKYLRRK